MAESSAALDEAYGPSPGKGFRVAIVLIITTAPPPCFFICGTQARVIRTEPSRLVSSTLVQVAKSGSDSGPKSP